MTRPRGVLLFATAVLLVAACSRSSEEVPTVPTESTMGTVTTTVPLLDLPPTERLAAAIELVASGSREAVDELGQALEQEIAAPSSGVGYGWYEYSENLQESYAALMVEAGAEAVPEIRRRAAEADGVARGWYIVVLAYLDEPVDDELLALLEDPPSRPIAAQVMSLVGRRGLEAATPLLREYLQDEFSVTDPHRPGRPPDYPLRDHAAAALRELGYTVYSPPERPWEYEVISP